MLRLVLSMSADFAVTSTLPYLLISSCSVLTLCINQTVYSLQQLQACHRTTELTDMPQNSSQLMTTLINGLESTDDLIAALSICDCSLQKDVGLKSLILTKLSSVSYSDYEKIAPALGRLCRLNNYDSDLTSYAVYFNWVIGDYKEASLLGIKSVSRQGINGSLLRNMVFLYLVSGEHDKLKWLLDQATLSNLEVSYWRGFLESLQQGAVANVRHPDSNLNFLFSISCFSTQSMEAALHHWQGKFCEENELSMLGKLCKNQHILEIGCLVGNHTVFMMLHGMAKSITCVDIDPRSCMMTTLNSRLNSISDKDIRVINAKAGSSDEKNQNDPLPIFYLDPSEATDYGLIKIDIDGGELQFLKASYDYLKHKRPIVFAEVQASHLADIHQIFGSISYSHKTIDVRQSGESNILFFP